MKSPRPVLSICVPTYNRAALLHEGLSAIVHQARELAEKVEVVVSDNCSSDGTREVVEAFQAQDQVRYSRNDENIGAGGNFFRLVNDLAQGEFCWIVGDDDLITEGAVRRIVDAIAAQPTLDYFFANYAYKPLFQRCAMPPFVHPVSEAGDLCCSPEDDQVVPRWEDLIAFSETASLFTFVACHVFRRSLWMEQSVSQHPNHGFQTLEDTFPHACLLARALVGKPAGYLGLPLLTLYVGTQEWFSRSWPMIQVVRVLEFSDLLQKSGARRAMVDRYRCRVFLTSQEHFWRLLRDELLLGREYFSLPSLFRRYWRYGAFWRMATGHAITAVALPRLKRPLGKLRGLLRQMRSWAFRQA